jgi:hypothetical protein
MTMIRDVHGLTVPLEPEEVFSEQILNQLRGCGFLYTKQ